MAQSVGGGTCGSTEAPDEVLFSARSPEHLLLLCKDGSNEIGGTACDRLLGPGFSRDGDDPALIGHEAEYPGKLGAIPPRNAPQSQITGKRVDVRECGPPLTRFNPKCQQVRDLPHQPNRIVTIEKATGVRLEIGRAHV